MYLGMRACRCACILKETHLCACARAHVCVCVRAPTLVCLAGCARLCACAAMPVKCEVRAANFTFSLVFFRRSHTLMTPVLMARRRLEVTMMDGLSDSPRSTLIVSPSLPSSLFLARNCRTSLACARRIEGVAVEIYGPWWGFVCPAQKPNVYVARYTQAGVCGVASTSQKGHSTNKCAHTCASKHAWRKGEHASESTSVCLPRPPEFHAQEQKRMTRAVRSACAVAHRAWRIEQSMGRAVRYKARRYRTMSAP